jgi:hypothetical protein
MSAVRLEMLGVRRSQSCGSLGRRIGDSEVENIGVRLRSRTRLSEELVGRHPGNPGFLDDKLSKLAIPSDVRLGRQEPSWIAKSGKCADPSNRCNDVRRVDSNLRIGFVKGRLQRGQCVRRQRCDQRQDDDDPLAAQEDRLVLRQGRWTISECLSR